MDKIMIEQDLGRGWVELIIVETEDGITEGEALQTVINLAKKLADSETMHITKEDGESIVITRANGPIRLKLI